MGVEGIKVLCVHPERGSPYNKPVRSVPLLLLLYIWGKLRQRAKACLDGACWSVMPPWMRNCRRKNLRDNRSSSLDVSSLRCLWHRQGAGGLKLGEVRSRNTDLVLRTLVLWSTWWGQGSLGRGITGNALKTTQESENTHFHHELGAKL